MTINPQQVTRDIERLRRLQNAIVKGRPFLLPEGAVTKLDQVERRLLEAVRRDNTGDPLNDGYPSGFVGSGGMDAAQSSTEAALLAQYDRDGNLLPTRPDPHHALTAAAVTALEQAADAISDLYGKLDAIDRLATIHRTDPSGHCAACSRWVEGTAVDRLRAGYCEACYRAWDRAGRPDRVQFERQRNTAA